MTTDNGVVIKRGDIITMDGTSGEVMLGDIAKTEASSSDDFQTLLSWADKHRRLGFAPTPKRPGRGQGPGAGRRGYRPVSHRAYVFDAERIDIMRAMILAEDLGTADIPRQAVRFPARGYPRTCSGHGWPAGEYAPA